MENDTSFYEFIKKYNDKPTKESTIAVGTQVPNTDYVPVGDMLHGMAELMRAYVEGCKTMFEMGRSLGMEMANEGDSQHLQNGRLEPDKTS